MKKVYNTRLYWKRVIRKVNESFLNLLDSDLTCKKITPGREKVLTLQKLIRIFTKSFRISRRFK